MRNWTSTVARLVPVFSLAILSAACAHGPAPRPELAAAHRVPDWTGVVRIAAGSYELVEGGEVKLIEAAIGGLVASFGSDIRVQCLEHESGGNGAVHARVRLEFPERMTLEQKFGALGALQGLSPTGEAYHLEQPLVGSVKGPALRTARR